MPRQLDDAPFDPECPQCGRKVGATLGDVRRGRTIRCPGGHVVEVQVSAKAERDLRKTEKALDDIGKAFK